MEKGKFGTVNRRQFIRGLGLGAGLLTLGKIDMAQAALLPKAKRSEKFNVIVIGTGLSGDGGRRGRSERRGESGGPGKDGRKGGRRQFHTCRRSHRHTPRKQSGGQERVF